MPHHLQSKRSAKLGRYLSNQRGAKVPERKPLTALIVQQRNCNEVRKS